MSEIELLYKNAGVKFIIGVHCRAKIGDGCKSRCPDCDYNTKPKEYPPFTAEKQLALIKWCIDNYRSEIFDTIETEWFEEQLSAYINNIWQDLTEQERTEIAEILRR